MALRATEVDPKLQEVVEGIARAVGRLGIPEGDPQSAKAILRVELEQDVKRVIQVYWTGFEANLPGACVGLHLEVAEPAVRWAEAYLSPDHRNWIFCFHERADGEVQLSHYRDYATPKETADVFFDLASWYVLTPSGLGWADVRHHVSNVFEWTDHHRGLATASSSKAIQESLKKSTIVWMRWTDAAGDERTMPVWFVLDQDKLYVLSGERQQTIPGADRLKECTVILRWKGKNSRVAEIPASVRVLEQGPAWDQIAEKIAEKRLNIPGLPEETARRWRDECLILELTLRT